MALFGVLGTALTILLNLSQFSSNIMEIIAGVKNIRTESEEDRVKKERDTDTKAIAELIDLEAISVIQEDLDSAISVYDENATIIQKSDPVKTWVRHDEIRDRYKKMFDGEDFTVLEHLHKEIELKPDSALVKAHTHAVFFSAADQTTHTIENQEGEEWMLQKRGGSWKVKRFTFGDNTLSY